MPKYVRRKLTLSAGTSTKISIKSTRPETRSRSLGVRLLSAIFTTTKIVYNLSSLNLYLFTYSINLIFFAAFQNHTYLFRRSCYKKMGGDLLLDHIKDIYSIIFDYEISIPSLINSFYHVLVFISTFFICYNFFVFIFFKHR